MLIQSPLNDYEVRMENKIKFERTYGARGTSFGINLPPELQEYLHLHVGDIVLLTAEHGKHGRYISLWKKGDQK